MNRKYTTGFSQSLVFSREEAMRLGSGVITTDHLLLGLLRDRDNSAASLLREFCDDLNVIKAELEQRMPPSMAPTVQRVEDLTIGASAAAILKDCVDEAAKLNADNISSIHLLLAILGQKSSTASQVLGEKGINYDSVLMHLTPSGNEVADSFGFEDDDLDEEEESEAPGRSQARTKNKLQRLEGDDTPFLDKYGVDFTQNARDGKLDPVVGRAKEIERIAQILSRRKKNNPILLGEPGVGKTAIVEGLAERIVKRQVPMVLLDKKIVALNMSAMVAGTKYRGQFEERVQGVMEELAAHPEVILFIDEIHTIVGAGSAAGSMDAANMLKPALSRGQLQCIGSTTTDEYRKTIEKDGALERRFQKIMVEPTTPEETLEILQNLKEKYEEHHNVSYTDEALEACVSLTDRYISNRHLPDKAIDAMDEAGSRVHLTEVEIPQELTDMEAELNHLREEKMSAVQKQDFESAANFRDEEVRKEQQLNRMRQQWEEELKKNRLQVSRADVEETVSLMSGVPVQRVKATESIRLKGLKDDLQKNVIAQDPAIEKLVRAITRNRIGLRDPGKPIGTFLFLGPTGVGKTYLAKALAEYMFGSSDALIRIDMSEYMEKYSTSRLVGAPPGYVGYDEGGQLTERVRRRPYSIVLLDEIEKANKDVFNILLQVMDEGRLTDSNGNTVDFKNTIIIITSNVGTRQVSDFGRGVGFRSSDVEDSRKLSDEIIRKALDKQFAPEFLNRLDEIITFQPLDKEAIGHIADLEIGKLNTRLQNLGYSCTLDKKAHDFIVEKGYDPKYGARPLKRAIQTYVEDGLSDFLLGAGAPEGGKIQVTRHKNEEKLTFM